MNYYDYAACENLVKTMLKQSVDFARGENLSAYVVNKADVTLERSNCINFILSEDFVWYMTMFNPHEENIERVIEYALEKVDVYQPDLLARTSVIG